MKLSDIQTSIDSKEEQFRNVPQDVTLYTKMETELLKSFITDLANASKVDVKELIEGAKLIKANLKFV